MTAPSLPVVATGFVQVLPSGAWTTTVHARLARGQTDDEIEPLGGRELHVEADGPSFELDPDVGSS